MADAKISELSSLTGANLQGVDLLPIVDSDANNDGTLTDKETKSISITELRKNIISVTDSGGDGSLSYDSAGGTGVITYTGPSASETRAHFSGGTGVDISSGSISIGQSVATNANVQFNQVTASLVGNASTASTLATARNIALTGAVSGNADFNGGANISISTTLASHTHAVGEITGAAPLASPTFTGTVTVSGNIVPNANETLDIGTSSLRFRDLFLSGDTLDLGGTKVKKNTDGDIEIRDASNNFKKVKASEIELEDAQDASNKVVIRMDSSGVPELTKINKTNGAAVETDVKFTTLTVAKNITASTLPTDGGHLTNKSYVDGQISALVDGAPAALNTLNEIALALNDSPSQIDNILTSVGQRLVIGNNLSDLNNAATARTNLGLGNVENTAISTFAGSSNITTVGTLTSLTTSGDITLSQGANRTIKVATATVSNDGNNLTIEGGQFKSGTDGNGGSLTLKGGAGDSSDGNGGDLILEPGAGETAGVLQIKGSSFQLDNASAQTAFRTAIGAGTGTYGDGSIINTNQVNGYANGTLFIRGKSGPTAYPVQITGGSETGDNGDGSDVTIEGGQSGGDGGNGGDVTIKGGAGESANGKVILGGTNTLQIEADSAISMGNNAINTTTGGFSSTSGNISTGGTITSTSSTKRPIQNDESDSTPIRTIRRMTQSDYDTLANTSPTSIDDNTLYIIV